MRIASGTATIAMKRLSARSYLAILWGSPERDCSAELRVTVERDCVRPYYEEINLVRE